MKFKQILVTLLVVLAVLITAQAAWGAVPVWDTSIADQTIIEGSVKKVIVEDLSTYVSDDNTAHTITFTVQTEDTSKVDCTITGKKLEIQPVSDFKGRSSCTIRAKDSSTNPANYKDDTFDINVNPALEISNVKLNTAIVTEDSKASAVKPLDTIKLTFTVTNNYNYPITGINAQFNSNGLSTRTPASFNLGAAGSTDASKPVELTATIPVSWVEGAYNASLTITGKGLDNIARNDEFPFLMDIIQDLSNLSITNLTATDTDVTCKESTTLNLKIANTGKNTENNVLIEVTDEDGEVLSTSTVSINKNTEYTFPITISSTKINEDDSLTAKISYRDDYYSDTELISITKGFCNPLPGSFDTGEVVLGDLTETELKNLVDFSVSNAKGTIDFGSNLVDLSNVVNLDSVITIADNSVAVNSEVITNLNNPVTVTLNKAFTHPVIMKSTGYNTGSFAQCTDCTIATAQTAGTFTFTVTGFSTYQVLEATLPTVQISAISIENAERTTEVQATVTIKNIGTSGSLNALSATLVGVSTDYNAQIVGTLPSTLAAGAETTLTLKLTVPEDEDGGKHSIGSLRVSSTESTKTQYIYLSPKSYLTVSEIEINGKTSGELLLDEINEIVVTVQNDYTEDLENVKVTATLLDVDGNDIDQESEEFDLNKGDDKDVEFEFDLTSENIEEDEYTLEIVVEGTGEDDNSDQITTITKSITVKRENHQIIIQEAQFTSTSTCLTQNTLEVTLENVGKNDEDGVEITVENSALGVDFSRSNLELDSYSDSDNEYTTSFTINLEDVKAGTYPIVIKAYIDGDLQQSKTVDLVVGSCSTTSGQSGATLSDSQLQQQLQAQVNALLQARNAAQTGTTTSVNASFRDSNTYVLALGALVLLVFIAIVLALALGTIGRRRRE